MIEGLCHFEWIEVNYEGEVKLLELKKWSYDFERVLRKEMNNSRESSLAITRFEECVMWAAKAISLQNRK